MSTYQGTYSSLLGGVSQQVDTARLPNQCTEQINMICDPVWGLRRRPSTYATPTLFDSIPKARIKQIKTGLLQIGDERYHYVLFTHTGTIHLMKDDGLYTSVGSGSSSYLIASDASKIQFANVSGYAWFLNTEKKPKLATTNLATFKNPKRTAFYYVKAGAFRKPFTLTITLGSHTETTTYTTSDGSDGSEALAASPKGIAQAMYNHFRPLFTTAELRMVIEDNYIWFESLNGQDLTVTAPIDLIYYIASGTMSIRQDVDLPPVLPSQAVGAVVSVGTNRLGMVYYRYSLVDGTPTWVECAEYGSANKILDMPVRLTIDSTIRFDNTMFEGRTAGNEESNPYPYFIENGITGLGAYQSRLMLLSGAYVQFSASNKSYRMLRSTITQLRDDDPIEVSIGTLTSANFKWAVPSNRDMLLVSDTHQAVISSGNQAMTPKNVYMVQFATQSIDTTVRPVLLDRNVLYTGRSFNNTMNVGEFTQPEYNTGIYVPNNLTDHLPSYLKGKPLVFVGSPTINIALLVADDRRTVYVYEFLWQGRERVLQSWHTWVFPLDIVDMYFNKDVLEIFFHNDNRMIRCNMIPRQFDPTGAEPCGDVLTEFNGVLSPFISLGDTSNVRIYQTGERSPEYVGIKTITGAQVELVPSYEPTTPHMQGYKFDSYYHLTRPSFKDRDGKPIHTKVSIKNYIVNLRNSGYFNYSIGSIDGDTLEPLTWSTVAINKARIETNNVRIPVRDLSRTNQGLNMHCDRATDMNLIDVTYTLSAVMKHRRVY